MISASKSLTDKRYNSDKRTVPTEITWTCGTSIPSDTTRVPINSDTERPQPGTPFVAEIQRMRRLIIPLTACFLLTGCARGRFARDRAASPAESTIGTPDPLTSFPTPQNDPVRLVSAEQREMTRTPSAVTELAQPVEVSSNDQPGGEPTGAVPLQTIDLAAALSMVAGQHPLVEIARCRTQQAYAQLAAAKTLWLPTIQAGASYHRLDGNLQASTGQILDINRSSMQAGLGAGAVGAGQTIRPGLVAQFHFADALYQPKIAERRAWARSHASMAALHDQLLAAALAHQTLLGAEQRLALIRDHNQRVAVLAKLTSDFANAGEGLRADADRLATEMRLSEAELRRGEEEVVSASARLAESISAPPGTLLTCVEPAATPIDLLPVHGEPVDLVSTGLSNRPELKEAQCLVAEACERLRRERSAPLVPSMLLGMSYGGFGGGLGGTIDQFRDRAEFNALATWQVRNLGFGEAAARRERQSQVQQATFERVRVMDRVAREIVEAHGRLLARSDRIAATKAAIQTAVDSYDRNLVRIRQGHGLPIEALQSVQALDAARQAYLDAVLDYNESQLRLYCALGWPVSD